MEYIMNAITARAITTTASEYPNRTGILTRLLLVAALATTAVMASGNAFAERNSSVEDTQMAGTHAYEKSWHGVTPRRGQAQKVPSADKGSASTQQAPSAGKRVNARLPCHPDPSKCRR